MIRTVCTECKYCRSDMFRGYICCIEEFTDPVYGKMVRIDAECRDKNTGDCPDYQPKMVKRSFLRKLFGGKS